MHGEDPYTDSTILGESLGFINSIVGNSRSVLSVAVGHMQGLPVSSSISWIQGLSYISPKSKQHWYRARVLDKLKAKPSSHLTSLSTSADPVLEHAGKMCGGEHSAALRNVNYHSSPQREPLVVFAKGLGGHRSQAM